MRFIGDVHGHHEQYLKLTEGQRYTIQLGDFGDTNIDIHPSKRGRMSYEVLNKLDPHKHKILGGNHDNYSRGVLGNFCHMDTKHWLGDYGTIDIPTFGEIFFVRGATSVDKNSRIEGIDYWKDECLSYQDLCLAINEYERKKPDVVISHDCPASIFGYSWPTTEALDQMFDIHKPAIWIFGHHHKKWAENRNGTEFLCLPVLEYVDF